MPSSKPSDKKKSSSAAKKSRRTSSATASRSKDRDKPKKSKERKSTTKDKAAELSSAPTPASTPSTEPVAHDPDAIQLFRRYDRARSGALTRLDFLQLLRDYANPNGPGDGTTKPARAPLSLTDSSGIPLGYARADRNSEFEAGQLFERYDRSHTGALTLEEFHVFFADFKPQLRAFVEDCNYGSHTPPPATVIPAPLHPVKEEEHEQVASASTKRVSDATTDPLDEVPVESTKALRTQYRSALWKLRRVCKEELFDQRELLLRLMGAMREGMSSLQRSSGGIHTKRRPRLTPFLAFERSSNGDETGEDLAQRYETLEDDLERLDELVRVVRRHLHKGDGASRREMLAFLAQADDLQEEAQALAMKDYGALERRTSSKQETEAEHADSPPPAPAPAPAPASVSDTASPHQHDHHKQSELEGLLRVKDQMIFQLLQERTAMRKERVALETNLKQLSDVSTHEMEKWARLTDDMQAEIEQLRERLKRSQSPSQCQRQRQRHSFV